MEQEDSLGGGGGRDSPLRPSAGNGLEGEDILAKLRQQVSAASLMNHHYGGHLNHHPNHLNNSSPPPDSPLHSNGHNAIYDRIHTLLQAKMKREVSPFKHFIFTTPK